MNKIGGQEVTQSSKHKKCDGVMPKPKKKMNVSHSRGGSSSRKVLNPRKANPRKAIPLFTWKPWVRQVDEITGVSLSRVMLRSCLGPCLGPSRSLSEVKNIGSRSIPSRGPYGNQCSYPGHVGSLPVCSLVHPILGAGDLGFHSQMV